MPDSHPKPIPIPGVYVSILLSQFKGIPLMKFPFGQEQEFTERMPLWQISGKERTYGDGKRVLHMNNYLTWPIEPLPPYFNMEINGEAIIDEKPIFIASPISDTAVVLTTKVVTQEIDDVSTYYHDLFTLDYYQYSIPNTPKLYDVNIEVTSWKLDGTVAPNTSFSWVFIAAGCLIGRYL